MAGDEEVHQTCGLSPVIYLEVRLQHTSVEVMHYLCLRPKWTMVGVAELCIWKQWYILASICNRMARLSLPGLLFHTNMVYHPKMVTGPSSNWAQRRAFMLAKTNLTNCHLPTIMDIPGGAKKWNIHALHRYLLNTGFVFVDHWSRELLKQNNWYSLQFC